MAYNLIITPHADELLDRLVSFLLIQKQNPQAASHLLDAVSDVYDRLESNPFQFPVSRDPFLAAKNYRIAVTMGMNYVIAFKVEQSSAVVYGVFHGLENYPNKLS